jgi:quercetin 2,3-dioxygenase
MALRSINRILKPSLNYIGHLVAYHFNDLPFEDFDPFLMLAHHGPQQMEKYNKGLPFAPHPHRGFETVTFIFDGDVKHHDSQGIISIINKGGVQWMTAGKGIVHTEDTSDAFKEHGGTLDIIQLWINLPSRMKLIPPRYQGINENSIPVKELDHGKVKVSVISGVFEDKRGPAESITGIQMNTISMEAGSVFETAIEKDRNILLYILNGQVEVNDTTVDGRALVLFNNDDTGIKIEARSDTTMIFGTGKPYHEKIAAYGPFVMNTTTEIMEAQRDYQMGKMGILFE